MKKQNTITKSSTAEYFAKNLQQVGFSSPIKAVLTSLKEAVDNSLDACEESGILPDISLAIEKLGPGTTKNVDQIKIVVTDNGPGISKKDVPRVFGEYLASSKFGRGRCSRGQQGIGISAATTWAQLTNAKGISVITKTKADKKAYKCIVEVDIQQNMGIIKNEESIDWDYDHGTSIELIIDGKVQLNGEAGILNYLTGTALVNPHMSLEYKLPDLELVRIERVTTEIPAIPESTPPHPHTMKLGEFISHSHLFPGKTKNWLKEGFSRITDSVIADIIKSGVPKKITEKQTSDLADDEFKILFSSIQNLNLLAPSTKSVLTIGEDSLSKSIKRLGDIDFFSVVSRKPTICDFKPVQIEVAIARLNKETNEGLGDSPVQILRFANRVPLQFDKSACAISQAITSVNWKAYGLSQPKDSLPLGPYIFAVSVVSPFIKFKNASKETVDASDELVEEIRLALIQAGQRLAKHIKKEIKAGELEEKRQYIEQFCPILIQALCRITEAPASRKKQAERGLKKILGRDVDEVQEQFDDAEADLEKQKKKD